MEFINNLWKICRKTCLNFTWIHFVVFWRNNFRWPLGNFTLDHIPQIRISIFMDDISKNEWSWILQNFQGVETFEFWPKILSCCVLTKDFYSVVRGLFCYFWFTSKSCWSEISVGKTSIHRSFFNVKISSLFSKLSRHFSKYEKLSWLVVVLPVRFSRKYSVFVQSESLAFSSTQFTPIYFFTAS